MTQFIRITVTPLRDGETVIYEYGEFESLEDMQDFSFNAATWSCRYLSFHDVGQPYQMYFMAMIGPDYVLRPDGRFHHKRGDWRLFNQRLDAMIILS